MNFYNQNSFIVLQKKKNQLIYFIKKLSWLIDLSLYIYCQETNQRLFYKYDKNL